MTNRSQDIYDIQHPDRDGEGSLSPNVVRTAQDVWAREFRRSRRSSFFFGAVIFLFSALICVIAFQQYLLSSRVAEAERSRSRTSGTRVSVRPSFVDLDPSGEMSLVIDDLIEQEEIDIPEEGNLPLNTQWIKQAAYYVVLAEKAYKDGHLEDALENYQTALKIYPGLQGAHRYLGLIYLQLKDYTSAAEAFQKASQKDESSFGVVNNLGVAYLALEDYGKAEEYLLRALNLKPDYAAAYLNLATLHLRADHQERSAQYFKEYLSLEPDNIEAMQTYASILMRLEQWEDAIKLLRQLRDDAPDVAPVYFLLAQALSHTDADDEAMVVLQRGATLVDPRKALAWLSQSDFDILREHPQFVELVAALSAAED